MAELSKIPFVEGCVDKSSNTGLKLALLVPPFVFLCAYPGNIYSSSRSLRYTTDGSKAPHMEISEPTINSILQFPPKIMHPGDAMQRHFKHHDWRIKYNLLS